MTNKKSVVIFDDQSLACSNFKDWLHSRDHDNRIKFEEMSNHRYEQNSLQYITSDGSKVSGARAVLIAISHTGGTIGFAARVFSIWPFFVLFVPFYSLFARNRKKINKLFKTDETT